MIFYYIKPNSINSPWIYTQKNLNINSSQRYLFSFTISIFFSNYLSLLKKDNENKIQSCFITIIINSCCFKVNLFTHLNNFFSLMNQLIKLIFL